MKISDPKDETCTAHNRQGGRCKRAPAKGQKVCRMHGGAAPQSIEAAQRRLLAAADPAAAQLVDLLENGENENTRLAAAKDLLDRVGLSGKVKFEGEVKHGFDDDAYQSVLGRIAELAERRRADGDTPGVKP